MTTDRIIDTTGRVRNVTSQLSPPTSPLRHNSRLVIWRNAAVELPDDELTVLGYLKDGEIELVSRDGSMPDAAGNCWMHANTLGAPAEVLYWMELPEPPTRDAR